MSCASREEEEQGDFDAWLRWDRLNNPRPSDQPAHVPKRSGHCDRCRKFSEELRTIDDPVNDGPTDLCPPCAILIESAMEQSRDYASYE